MVNVLAVNDIHRIIAIYPILKELECHSKYILKYAKEPYTYENNKHLHDRIDKLIPLYIDIVDDYCDREKLDIESKNLSLELIKNFDNKISNLIMPRLIDTVKLLDNFVESSGEEKRKYLKEIKKRGVISKRPKDLTDRY